MAYLELYNECPEEKSVNNSIKIMIFTEGTILGPPSIMQHFNHASYIPINNAVKIIKTWEEQGAQIIYFTSRKKLKQVHEIKEILLQYNFPGRYLYYREKGQRYKDIVELVLPDILIEDDCRSIGGKWQMCITYIRPEVKRRVKSIVVEEFGGIDNLPSLLSELLNS